jgi:GT2 family glycosyltransferase
LKIEKANLQSSIFNLQSSMSADPETSVIILNWNGARLLPECLSALASQTYRDFELFLVDNGSIDASRLLLKDLERTEQPVWMSAALPRPAKIIRNEDNVGFAVANNQAIRQSRAKYIALLNNDAIPAPDWLAEIVGTMESGPPSVGMVASTMLFEHLPDVVASAGISIHRDGVALDRGLGLSSVALQEGGVRPVFGPSAGAALYRAELFKDIGLFDERFFSYLEDADLAWRARWRGWKALHNPRATARHIYSATGIQESPFKRRLISRNRVWTLYKNMPEALLRRYAGLIIRYDALVILRGVLTRDRHSIRGRFEGLLRLGEFTEDRRKITTCMRVHPDEMAQMLAPALSPLQALKYRKRLNFLLHSRPERET